MKLDIDQLSQESLEKMEEMIGSSDYNKTEFTSLAEMFAGKMVGLYRVKADKIKARDDLVVARANRDFSNNYYDNSWPHGSPEHRVYDERMKELNK